MITADKADHAHILAYVKTSKVADWKRIALLYGDDRGPAFVYRSDDDRTFAKYARSKAVLWIIESHASNPPSLVARLEIVGQLHAKLDINVLETTGNANVPGDMLHAFEYGRKLRWYAVGDPKRSRFFGYNDVSDALLKTDFEGTPAPWRGADKWSPSFGQSLQRPRRFGSGIEELEKLADALTNRSVFLSWKHCDFQNRHHEIRSLVDTLAGKGIDCWWDQLALPKSRAVDRLVKHPGLLKNLLEYGLSRSKILLALGSTNWGRTSLHHPGQNWTRGEWDQSIIRFAYDLGGPPEHGWPSQPDARFARDMPLSVVARKITDKLVALGCEPFK